jgi:hypothetical protein
MNSKVYYIEHMRSKKHHTIFYTDSYFNGESITLRDNEYGNLTPQELGINKIGSIKLSPYMHIIIQNKEGRMFETMSGPQTSYYKSLPIDIVDSFKIYIMPLQAEPFSVCPNNQYDIKNIFLLLVLLIIILVVICYLSQKYMK